MTNATEGVNAVVAPDLRPGDELLTSTHEQRLQQRADVRRSGRASVRTIDLPFPLSDSAEVAERIIAAITDRTRLVLISHVTSPTALVVYRSDCLRVQTVAHRHADRRVTHRYGAGRSSDTQSYFLHGKLSQVAVFPQRGGVPVGSRRSPEFDQARGHFPRSKLASYGSSSTVARVRLLRHA